MVVRSRMFRSIQCTMEIQCFCSIPIQERENVASTPSAGFTKQNKRL